MTKADRVGAARGLREYLRFIATGALATASSYGTFLVALRAFSAPYLLAYVAACVVGIAIGYVINSGWTFGKKRRSLQQALAYAAVQAGVLVSMAWVLTFEVSRLHWPPEVAALVNIPTSAGLGFLLMRALVFRDRPRV